MGYLTPDLLELLGSDDELGNPPAPGGLRAPPGAGKDVMIAGDAYEGASRTKAELSSFNPIMRSADGDLAGAKRTSDLRSRDLSRNDAYVQSGTTIRKDNIVGSYFMLNAKPNSSRLFGKLDQTWEDEFQEEVEEKFAAYAESYECWIDIGRRNTLTGLVRMAVDQLTVYGEYLATVEWKRDSGRPFSTAIHVIDTDRLSNPPKIGSRENVFLGVHMDSDSAPIGYHIRKAHPTDFRKPESQQWKYVPARKPWGRMQVLHQFEQVRPDQTRGIGVMVAAIPDMKMSRKLRELILQNAVLNATYAATLESDLPSEVIFARLGGSDFAPEQVQEALTTYMGGYYNLLSDLTGGSKNLTIDGVRIPHLPPGSKLNINSPGAGGPLGSDFEVSLQRVMAAAFGLSYEQFSRDYTKTNYSGFKGSLAESYKAMLSVKRLFAERFASYCYRLWLEEALNKGEITAIRRSMPSWYEGQNAEWYAACDWIGAFQGQIDELKETQASVMKLQNGLSTLEIENAKAGNDWRRIMRQIKREQDVKDALDILQNETDTTNQENAARGTKREGRAAASLIDTDEDERETVNA
jgi:lambda family phage portal protein